MPLDWQAGSPLPLRKESGLILQVLVGVCHYPLKHDMTGPATPMQSTGLFLRLQTRSDHAVAPGTGQHDLVMKDQRVETLVDEWTDDSNIPHSQSLPWGVG